MKTYNTANLIDELISITATNVQDVQSFLSLTAAQLNYKTDPVSWSILECIEHLNRYGDFYIPEIDKRIQGADYPTASLFSSGLLGNYFAKSMMPKEQLNKMKTFQSMNPVNSLLNRNVLDTFLKQQQQLLTLLTQARQTDLTKVKTAISISRFIKLRLGDTLRVVIYHNQRHIAQAQKLVS